MFWVSEFSGFLRYTKYMYEHYTFYGLWVMNSNTRVDARVKANRCSDVKLDT